MTEPEPLDIFVDLDDEKRVGQAVRTLLRLLAAHQADDGGEIFKSEVRETAGQGTPALTSEQAAERFVYLLYASTLLATGLKIAGEKAQLRLIREHDLDNSELISRDQLTDVAEEVIEKLIARQGRNATDE